MYLVLSDSCFLIFALCLEDVLDEATRKDLFTDTFCKVCRAVLQSESQTMSHCEVGWKGGLLPASSGVLVSSGFLYGVIKRYLRLFMVFLKVYARLSH